MGRVRQAAGGRALAAAVLGLASVTALAGTATFGAGPALAASASSSPGAGPALAASASSSPGPGPVTVYPLGDSITYGVSGPYAITPGGYRGTLAQDLAADGVDIDYVGTSTENPPASTDPGSYRHDGHPGFRIDQLANDLNHADPYAGDDGGDWLTGDPQHSSIHPQVTVLLIGTNDVLQSYDPEHRFPGGYDGSNASERAVFVSDMVWRLWYLLDQLQRLAPRERLVLCTIPTIGIQTHNPTALAYDDALRDQVLPEARDRHMQVVLADVERIFLDQPADQPDLVGPDQIHPTPVGYQKMAGVIAPAVEQALALR